MNTNLPVGQAENNVETLRPFGDNILAVCAAIDGRLVFGLGEGQPTALSDKDATEFRVDVSWKVYLRGKLVESKPIGHFLLHFDNMAFLFGAEAVAKEKAKLLELAAAEARKLSEAL